MRADCNNGPVNDHHAGATTAPTTVVAGTGSPAPKRLSRLGALRHRDYRYLLIGTMGSLMGDWIQSVGQGWLVYILSGSAAQLGIFAFVRGVAILAVMPCGGAIADRVNRRTLLVISTTLGALNATLLAVLVVTHHIALWQLYFTSIIDGTVASIGLPARQTMVYDVLGAEDLANGIALNAMGGNIVRIIGPSLGGLLIGVTGLSSCFVAQASSYAIATVAMFLIRTRGGQTSTRVSIIKSIADGVRYTAHESLMLTLLLVTLVPSLLVYPYVGFMPVFAEKVWKVGASGNGILLTGVGFGSIAGAAWVASHANIRRRGLIMFVSNIVYMLFVVAFATSPFFLLGFSCLIFAGVANSIYNTYNQTLLQLYVDDEYRGRVLSLYLMLSAITPVGSLAMGTMIDHFGARGVVAGWALVAALLMALITLRAKHARAL